MPKKLEIKNILKTSNGEIATSNKGGNPLWIQGGQSPNPSGRKRGQNAVRIAVRKFLTRNLTPMKLQKYLDHLNVKDQIQLLFALLPYHLTKETIQNEFERLPDDQLDELYSKAIARLEGQFHNKLLPIDEYRITK